MNQPASIRLKNISPLDRFAYLTATGFGAGFAPKAPGTFGALEGVAIFLLTLALHLSSAQHLILLVGLNILIFALGVWAAKRTCAISNLEDPSQVVIDEVSGQLIALTPLAFGASTPRVILAFILFRLFDIFKPYPIRKLEHFPNGFGVMLDDVLAGIYAAVLIGLVRYFRLL
ncbi:MAG: phosphatidylglycerophosphatase A [Acidobacteria bacterium]|nr:phosphatidylglycerophosphatase A [Acidobacteriota bacterium]